MNKLLSTFKYHLELRCIYLYWHVCVSVCACMHSLHTELPMYQKYVCHTIWARSKFESCQVSEMFGSKLVAQHPIGKKEKKRPYSKLRIHLKLKHFSPVTFFLVVMTFEFCRWDTVAWKTQKQYVSTKVTSQDGIQISN